MTEYQVTRWRELPLMVAARAGDETVKSELAPRFQEALDLVSAELDAHWPTDRISAYLDGLGR